MAATRITSASILWMFLLWIVSSTTTTAETPWELVSSSSAPLIMSANDSIVVDVGGTLNLTCRDAQRVVWATLQSTLLYENYEETYDVGHEQPYIANLVIENINYTNVGYYFCVHNTTENKNKIHWSPTDANVSAIYVYVKDLEHLLAKEAEMVIYYPVINQEFTFPCKPTFPEVEVVLDKNQGDFESIYDPRSGFLLGNPSVQSHSGDYFCEASYGERNELSIISLIVVSDQTEILERPNVEVDHAWQKNEIKEHQDGREHYDVEEGSSVNLTCTYDNDPTSRRRLIWKLARSTSNKSGNHLIHRSVDRGLRITRILEITHANPITDSGEYHCIAENLMKQNSKSEPHTVVINVLPVNYSNVSLLAETTDLEVAQHEGASWAVMYSAYPEPTFIWRKGDDILANSSNPKQGSKRYTLDPLLQGGRLFLEIETASINDIGVYTLEGLIRESGKIISRDSIQLHLTMPVAPSVPTIEFWINDAEVTSGMIPQHQDFKLMCKSHGYPKPEISLEFSQCYNKDNCTGFEKLSMDEKDHRNLLRRIVLDQTEKSPINKTGVWEGKALVQGYYRCSAENKHDKIQNDGREFLVTDGGSDLLSLEVTVNGKSIQGRELKVLEDDNVTVLCRGNKLKVLPPLNWELNDEHLSSSNVSTRSKITMIYADTEVSYVSMIRIERISLEEKHLKFVCETEGTSDFMAAQDIYIEPMKAPKWLTKENPLQDHNKKERDSLSLNCPAIGAPKPEVNWYKDDVPLRATDETDKKHRIINGTMINFGYLKISDSGVYKCEATNRNGTIYSTASITITDPDAFVNMNIIIIVVVLSSILILVSIFLCRKIHKDRKLAYSIRLEDQRMFENGDPENLNPELGLDEQAELLPYDTKYEVSRDSIIFDKLLGAGAFGRVYRATAMNLIPGQARTTVAVKMMKSRTDCAQLKALRSEVKIMIHIGRHINIVNLLGACSKELASKGELLLLVEYCRYGNILDYMRRHRKDFINQINENDKIDPSLSDPRIRQRSGSRSRMSRGLKYAHLSFNQEVVTYTPGQMPGSELSNQALWVEPSTPTGSNGTNGHIVPESFRTRTLSGSSAVHVTSDMSTMTFESSNGTSDGYLGSRVVGPSPVTLCSKELLCWAFQIAKGMEYLAFKKVLHGDLAARNILLTEDNIVKISDFGLAKDIYKNDNYRKKSKTPLPWKWLALECFRDGVFSTQSDIWSYGVVLWEIFTLGQSPYPGVEFDNTFITKLEKGIRLEQPKYATLELYRIMMECWGDDPMERPSFSVLEAKLGTMLGEAEKQHYLELSTPYQLENTASTFVNFLQSPDYTAKVRDRNPNLDQDGYEMPFSPSPYGAMAMPLSEESIRSPRLTPLQMDYIQNSDGVDGAVLEDSTGLYVPMSSPTKITQNVFSFDKEIVDSIAKRDSEVQMDSERNGDDGIMEENYLSMQNSPNSEKSPRYRSQSGDTAPLRHKLLRTASQMEKHDSGLYSPTANMQVNPHYMIMDSFPKTDENNYLTKDNVFDLYNGKQHDYINLNDDIIRSPKSLQRDYLKDGMCNGEYANLLPNDSCRGRTISETSSGLGSTSEESPPECRGKPDSLKSCIMESVLEEPVCV